MDAGRSPLKAFFDELARRKVLRVLVVYLAVGWGVIEVADTVFPRLALPEWTVTLVVALVVLGLPVALVLAWAFDLTPRGVERTPAQADVGPRAAGGRRITAGRIAVAGAVVVLAIAGGAFVVWGPNGEGASELDDGLVAVLPFRVSGQPSLEYLSTGMVDLLALTLTGEGGPRAVDPALVLSKATTDSASVVARALGAGQVLTGSVVGSPAAVTLTASLRGTAGGAATETRVVGSADSLPQLVDRLVAQLLSLRAGEEAQRATALGSRPLPAVRAFLQGQTAFRASRFQDAIEAYDRSLAADSTFALAALQYDRALGWNIGATRQGERARARRLAWIYREQLSAPDQLFLSATLGPNYPGATDYADIIREWERVVGQMPERPDAWFTLGDMLMHYGLATDRANAIGAAASAFRRTLTLDSTYVPALEHLMDLAMFQGDSAEVARIADLWSERDTTRYVRDRRDHARAATGDTLAAARLRDGLATADREALVATYWLATFPFKGAFGTEDAEAALAILLEGSGSRAEREQALVLARRAHLNAGRPREALEFGERRREVESWPGEEALDRVWDALLWAGDSAAAREAAARLAPLASDGSEEPSTRRREILCALSLWRLSRGGEAGSGADILSRHPSPNGAEAARSRLCASMIEAWASAERTPGVLTPQIERLDSTLSTGPAVGVDARTRGNLVLGRLLEQAGAPDRALRAVRRSSLLPGIELYLSAAYLEEGRFAAAVGDVDGAVEAYSKFLRLHADPEPSRQPQVERVRKELERLRGRG